MPFSQGTMMPYALPGRASLQVVASRDMGFTRETEHMPVIELEIVVGVGMSS